MGNQEFEGIIKLFTEYSLDQLYSLFAKNVEEIKTMMSQELVRELYTTKIWCINVSNPTSQQLLLHTNTVRGWFLISNSTQGEIELKFIPSNIEIGKLSLPEQYIAFNKDIYLIGYPEDYIYLLWNNLNLYTKIMAQIEILE